MPAKRSIPKPVEPVTEAEVSEVVKRAIVTAFKGRPLDPDVARRGLGHAAHDMINLKLETVAKANPPRRR